MLMTQRPLGCKAADPTMTNWEVAPAISISRLVKSFGSTRALDELDLVVKTGEVHGCLGPNGAGKTTTIRVLLGLLTAWVCAPRSRHRHTPSPRSYCQCCSVAALTAQQWIGCHG